jgi:hypothetical protein
MLERSNPPLLIAVGELIVLDSVPGFLLFALQDFLIADRVVKTRSLGPAVEVHAHELDVCDTGELGVMVGEQSVGVHVDIPEQLLDLGRLEDVLQGDLVRVGSGTESVLDNVPGAPRISWRLIVSSSSSSKMRKNFCLMKSETICMERSLPSDFM